MGIKIGDNNRIKNSIITDRIKTSNEVVNKNTFFQKHPVICGFLISLAAGLVLLFSF